MTKPTARQRAAAVAGAHRHRPAGLDVERVAEAGAKARRTPAIAQAATAPPAGDVDPLELTDAEATVVEELEAKARRSRTTSPADAVLAAIPPGPPVTGRP